MRLVPHVLDETKRLNAIEVSGSCPRAVLAHARVVTNSMQAPNSESKMRRGTTVRVHFPRVSWPKRSDDESCDKAIKRLNAWARRREEKPTKGRLVVCGTCVLAVRVSV